MPNSPSIVFVPGFWEGPTVFELVAATLRDTYGYKTEIASLPSTGQASPENPTMQDDIQAVHAFIERLVANREDVLLVLHSASGFIGTEAIKNLTAKERLSSEIVSCEAGHMVMLSQPEKVIRVIHTAAENL